MRYRTRRALCLTWSLRSPDPRLLIWWRSDECDNLCKIVGALENVHTQAYGAAELDDDAEDDALLLLLLADEPLDDGVNIKQLGVGVSVALAVVVGVGVQGNIDEDNELLKPLLAELELDSVLLLEPALKLALDELELKPKLALDELELNPRPDDEVLPPSPVELELKPVVAVELDDELEPAAPALGPHATTNAAIATKATKTSANLFIFSPFLLTIYLLLQALNFCTETPV